MCVCVPFFSDVVFLLDRTFQPPQNVYTRYIQGRGRRGGGVGCISRRDDSVWLQEGNERGGGVRSVRETLSPPKRRSFVTVILVGIVRAFCIMVALFPPFCLFCGLVSDEKKQAW